MLHYLLPVKTYQMWKKEKARSQERTIIFLGNVFKMAFGGTHIPIQEWWKQLDSVGCGSLVQLRKKKEKKVRLSFSQVGYPRWLENPSHYLYLSAYSICSERCVLIGPEANCPPHCQIKAEFFLFFFFYIFLKVKKHKQKHPRKLGFFSRLVFELL